MFGNVVDFKYIGTTIAAQMLFVRKLRADSIGVILTAMPFFFLYFFSLIHADTIIGYRKVKIFYNKVNK
jgi:hypothetical protein